MTQLSSEILVDHLLSDFCDHHSNGEAAPPTIDGLEQLDLHAWVLQSPLPHAHVQRVDVPRHSTFFAVLEGHCHLKSSRGLWNVLVSSGDLLILRDATNFAISTTNFTNDTACGSSTDGALNGNPRSVQGDVLCLGFAAKNPTSVALVSALPPIVHVAGIRGSFNPWAACFVQLIIAESACPHLGSQSVLDRLVSSLVLKATLLQMQGGTGEFAPTPVLVDEEIELAMTRMQQALDRAWTLESLADEVGISRSAFAARFKSFIGQSPMAYLRSKRMKLASDLLRRSRSGLKEIALRTGYKTPSAFAIAFKRWAGVSPGEYRSSSQI